MVCVGLCSLVYAGISVLGGWFGKTVWISVLFFWYVVFLYICVFLVYKAKRKIDEKIMNDNLRAFQARRAEYAKRD